MHAYGVDPDNPADLDILGAVAQLRNGTLSSLELVDAFLRRIEERNGGAPTFDGEEGSINAWVRVYPELARKQAKLADERIAREGLSAPFLCGIPIGLKDIISVDGLPVTASSRVLEGHLARESSTVWLSMEKDGMVLIGHNHTHEFAAGGTTDQVGNPWSLERSVGGSSGGSAAAVAGGMIAASIGTDTAGSVRVPASFCGVSAMKPSLGSIPLDGIIPRAFTVDHVGPIAHTLADCRVLLDAMNPAIGNRSTWGGTPRHDVEPQNLTTKPLAGMTLALTERSHNSSASLDASDALEIAVNAAVALGATVKELRSPAEFSWAELGTIMLAEALVYHAKFDKKRSEYRASIAQYLDRDSGEISAAEYINAQMARTELTGRWSRWFYENSIDAILEPTVLVDVPMRGSGYLAGQPTSKLADLTALWNLTGFPVATFPTHVGTRSKLPASVSMISTRGRDNTVLDAGSAIQSYIGKCIH